MKKIILLIIKNFKVVQMEVKYFQNQVKKVGWITVSNFPVNTKQHRPREICCSHIYTACRQHILKILFLWVKNSLSL